MILLLTLLLFNETANSDTAGEKPAPIIPIYQRAHDLLSENKFYRPIDENHSEEQILDEFFSGVNQYLVDLERLIVDVDETNREKVHNYAYHMAGIWLDAIPLIQARVAGNPKLEARFARTTVSFFNVGSNLFKRTESYWDAYEFEKFLTELWAGTSFEPQAYYDLIYVLTSAGENELAVQIGEEFLNSYGDFAFRGETRDGYLGLYDWVADAATFAGDTQKAESLRNHKAYIRRQTALLANFSASPDSYQVDNEILIENHLRLLVEPALSR